MKHMKRWFSALLALLLALALAASALAEAQPAPAELFGRPWYNITIIGNLPDSAADAADDLYSYYNYDFVVAHQDAAANAVLGGDGEIKAAVKEALADTSLNDPSVEQLRIFYEQAMDTETRKKGDGLMELQPYLSAVANAETLEQLNAAILSEDFPFSPFVKLVVANDYVTGTNCVNIAANLAFSDEPATYDPPTDAMDWQLKLMAMGEKYQSLVIAYMMGGQDQVAAGSAASSVVDTERNWAVYADSATHYMAKEYGAYAEDTKSMTLNDLEILCPHFPLKETLAKFGKDKSERFVVIAPEWLAALDAFWTEENLNALRDVIIAKVMMECLPYLDRTKYNEQLAVLGEAVYGTGPGRQGKGAPGRHGQRPRGYTGRAHQRNEVDQRGCPRPGPGQNTEHEAQHPRAGRRLPGFQHPLPPEDGRGRHPAYQLSPDQSLVE